MKFFDQDNGQNGSKLFNDAFNQNDTESGPHESSKGKYETPEKCRKSEEPSMKSPQNH